MKNRKILIDGNHVICENLVQVIFILKKVLSIKMLFGGKSLGMYVRDSLNEFGAPSC